MPSPYRLVILRNCTVGSEDGFTFLYAFWTLCQVVLFVDL